MHRLPILAIAILAATATTATAGEPKMLGDYDLVRPVVESCTSAINSIDSIPMAEKAATLCDKARIPGAVSSAGQNTAFAGGPSLGQCGTYLTGAKAFAEMRGRMLSQPRDGDEIVLVGWRSRTEQLRLACIDSMIERPPLPRTTAPRLWD